MFNYTAVMILSILAIIFVIWQVISSIVKGKKDDHYNTTLPTLILWCILYAIMIQQVFLFLFNGVLYNVLNSNWSNENWHILLRVVKELVL